MEIGLGVSKVYDCDLLSYVFLRLLQEQVLEQALGADESCLEAERVSLVGNSRG